MTERKPARLGAPRKWSDADWDAAIQFFETNLQGSLKSLRPPGLPGYIVVWKRGRTDKRVRDLLAAATARRCAAMVAAGSRTGDGNRACGQDAVTAATSEKFGRGLKYSDEAYSEYLVRLRADETAKNLDEAQKLYWPGLPSFYSVLRRRKEQLRSLLSEKSFAVGRGKRPLHFREDVYAEAVRLFSTMSLTEYANHRRAVGQMPSAQAILKRAARDPEFARSLYSRRPKVDAQSYRYSEADYEEAISKIGQSGWAAYLNEREPGALPSLNAIYRRTGSDPALKARLRGKILERYSLKRQLKALSSRRGRSKAIERPDGQLARLLLQQDAYRIADKFVPRHYDRADRDDIKSDIVMAVIAGEFALDEIGENARWFISEHFRGGIFSSGRFGSVDAPIFSDSDTPLVDRLSSDDYLHAG
ncbi:hypothetical protein EOW77_0032285 [Bradyrhizobium yuanmingense]|uniref:hypothetical protein n=1 Tax=Bradyrhizobium yuanmingense TaxID=108015 RepID=UPI000FE3C1B2|nr:hypothetical protein [Bradyrhizobium yuanmingense]TGN75949.1 hypothetical protein EOW77_0032285 [Bradyrhizobium yuanmingense]